MTLLDKFAPHALEVLFEELVRKSIFLAAANERGGRYRAPVHQFYAGPPMFSMSSTIEDVPEPVPIVSVDMVTQEVTGSSEAIANMARMNFMQKYIAHQIREHSDRVTRALFMGEMSR